MSERNVRYAWRCRIPSFCLALLVAVGLIMSVSAAVSNPQDAVRSFYNVLLGNMQQGRTLGKSGRYARLAPVVDRTFDLPLMTRLAVGPAWETLAPPQQQQLQAAFAHYVTATYADQFDSYSGQQLQVTGERQTGNDIMVQTKIVKSNGETTKLDYLMRSDQGLEDLRCVPRRHDQPAGGASIGVLFNLAARGRRRSRDGAEPQDRPAANCGATVVGFSWRRL